MKLFTSALVSSLAALAAARSGPLGPQNYYPASPGLQIGVANLTVKCNITAYGILPINNIEVTALVQFTNANYVKLGGPIQIESGIGRVKIPGFLTGLLGVIAVDSLSGDVTELGIVADGTSEGVVDIAKILPLKITNATVTPGQDLYLQLPEKGGFSVTAHSDGKSEIITAALGSVKINATAHSKFLGNIPASVSCPALPRPVAIGFIRAEPDYNPPTVPKKVYDIVEVPKGSLLGTAGIEFICTADGIGQFSLPTYVTGFVSNLTVPAGQSFPIQYAHGNVKLPAKIINAAKEKYPTADSASISLSSLRFTAENASPAEQNGLKSTITTDTFKLGSRAVNVAIPKGDDNIPDITFTLDNKPGELALTFLSDAAGTLNVKSGSSTVKKVPFKCPAPTPVLGLFNINIV